MNFKPGDTIKGGEIKILSMLGLGGFSEVYLGQTPSGLKAVKVVDTSVWDPKDYEVFNSMLMNEASFLSTLRHPGLPCLSSFFAEGSRYFLVMDWIQGQTLESWVEKEGPLGLDDLLGLIGSLVEVLLYLHQREDGAVVFGDLKPANILRTTPGHYRLVDLGLTSKMGSLFSKKIAVLSPGYAAPERLLGRPSHPAEDLYGLGATIYFALSGQVPPTCLKSRLRERTVRDFLSQNAYGWGEAALHHFSNLLTLVLAATDHDQTARPLSVLSFSEVWKKTHDMRAQETESQQAATTKSIVSSLYQRKKRPPSP